MHLSRDSSLTTEYLPDLRRQAPALRSYRLIARILAERDGTAITHALVGRMCRDAEKKLAVLLADLATDTQ